MNSPEPKINTVVEDDFLGDVVDGLSKPPGSKSIPSRYLYDEKGCELFEAICETPEYYPTRTELSLMHRDAHTMAEVCGPNCRLVELGSGASIKTRMLLDELKSPASYVPVDIAPDYLIPSAKKLAKLYPELTIEPICANFAEDFELPAASPQTRDGLLLPRLDNRNFTRPASVKLVSRMRDMAGPSGGILIGMDMKKEVGLLVAAYNDTAGVTASFTANLLTRLKRQLGAELDADSFEHLARYTSLRVALKSISAACPTKRSSSAKRHLRSRKTS